MLCGGGVVCWQACVSGLPALPEQTLPAATNSPPQIKLALPEGQVPPEWVRELMESGLITEVRGWAAGWPRE